MDKQYSSLDFEAMVEGVPSRMIEGPIYLPYLKEKPEKLVNGMIWAESDGLHIYYNNLEKVVSGS